LELLFRPALPQIFAQGVAHVCIIYYTLHTIVKNFHGAQNRLQAASLGGRPTSLSPTPATDGMLWRHVGNRENGEVQAQARM
jgi:hypothetical protein